MDPGPAPGTAESMTVTVTDDMTARFSDEDVHPVYGTAALVSHMEQVSRRLLKPHLEPGEEGVGVHIEATHKAPVPVGGEVELTATVSEVSRDRLVTEVVARFEGLEVARGWFTQAVVHLETWRRKVGLA